MILNSYEEIISITLFDFRSIFWIYMYIYERKVMIMCVVKQLYTVNILFRNPYSFSAVEPICLPNLEKCSGEQNSWVAGTCTPVPVCHRLERRPSRGRPWEGMQMLLRGLSSASFYSGGEGLCLAKVGYIRVKPMQGGLYTILNVCLFAG